MLVFLSTTANRPSGSDLKKSDKKGGRNNSNDLCPFCAEAIMCHELEDEFIFGAFNVLWLDITMDDAPKTNASYPRSMKTLNLIEHPNQYMVGVKSGSKVW